MQIDPRIQLPPADSHPEGVKNTRAAATQVPAQAKPVDVTPAVAEDRVQLSSKHGEVQSLATSLSNVPEVRSDRVTEFQQQLQTGNYKPDSQKVADAIVADQFKVNVKA